MLFNYFYLDELFDEYNLYETKRLKIYIMDGLDYLSAAEKNYDVIFNDAYISDVPDAGLLSFNALNKVKKRLNPGGTYVINMIAAISGNAAYPLISELTYLKQFFEYTRFYKCRANVPANERQNCLIFASDTPI